MKLIVKPQELKSWMDRNKKSATDVASLTHVSIRTVERFLDGDVIPRPITLEAFRDLVQENALNEKKPLSS